MTGYASIYVSLLQNECNLLGFQPQEKATVLVVTFRSETSNHHLRHTKGGVSHRKRPLACKNALKVMQAEWTSCTSEQIPGTGTGSSRFPTISGRKGTLGIWAHPPWPHSLRSHSGQVARPVTPIWDAAGRQMSLDTSCHRVMRTPCDLGENLWAGSPRSFLGRGEMFFHTRLEQGGVELM